MAKGITMPVTADPETRRLHLLFDHRRTTDFVWGVIQKALDQFNLHSLQSNDLCITVKVAPDAQNMIDLQYTHIGYNRYSFESWTSDPVFMEVRINKECEPWVCAAGTWISFRQWLQQTAESQTDIWSDPEDDSAHRRTRWDKQWRLWQSNGQKFQLMKLPAEVREVVYGHVFDGGERSSCGRRYARLGKTDRWDRDRVAIQQPDTIMLRLNRQVYLEASHILYEHTVFRVTRACYFEQFLVRNSALASRIKRLEFALEFSEALSLFHVERIELDTGLCEAAHVFQHMKLKELTLEMEAPQHGASTITITGNNTWGTRYLAPCQKLCVDIVLSAALPFVAGNAVTVSGYAKTKQKRNFETECAEKRKVHLDWCATIPGGYEAWTIADHEAWKREEDGGVRLDGCQIAVQDKAAEEGGEVSDEDKRIWREGANRPPLCLCEVSCAHQTWDAEA